MTELADACSADDDHHGSSGQSRDQECNDNRDMPGRRENSIRTERVFCTRKSTSAIPRMTPMISVIHAQLIRVGLRASRRSAPAVGDESEAFTLD